MKAKIVFSEVACIREGSEVTIIDGSPSKIPPAFVEVRTLAEFHVHRDAFIEKAEASGLCGRIYSYKISGIAVRKFNQLGNVLVNKHVGEAAPDI